MLEKYVNPVKNKDVFDQMDDELAKRMSLETLSVVQAHQLFKILEEHNSGCPSGYEIQMEMLTSECPVFL
jgi:hypothetical protein